MDLMSYKYTQLAHPMVLAVLVREPTASRGGRALSTGRLLK
jgi:hypothetical protein